MPTPHAVRVRDLDELRRNGTRNHQGRRTSISSRRRSTAGAPTLWTARPAAGTTPESRSTRWNLSPHHGIAPSGPHRRSPICWR